MTEYLALPLAAAPFLAGRLPVPPAFGLYPGPLAEAALPAMRWLSDQSGEAAHLGILSGFEGLVLERVIGRAMIKFYVERGVRFPIHTSGPGKVILAFMPEAERERIMRMLPQRKASDVAKVPVPPLS